MLDAKDLTPVNNESYCLPSAIPGGSDIAKIFDEIVDDLELAGIELQQYHSEATKGQV